MNPQPNQISAFKYIFYTITTSVLLISIMGILYYQYVHLPKLQTETELAGPEAIDESAEIQKTLQGMEQATDTDILSPSDINTVLKNIKMQQEDEESVLSPEERKVILDNIKSLEE